ncbi:MAG: hypothetical protein M1820_003895 [Bogoriella megaspora]|nr:MAG: hypothetical protein M1820_003895 [Bogoriella megaspora]
MSGISLLWAAPVVNPVNNKARSIPVLNPINVYGRVWWFAWFGFFIAFWSWYAFPPLLQDVIAKDIGLNQTQLSNSNIIALVATLLVRLVAGPCCDRFGPRYTFAGCLLAGAIPTWCAGGVTNPAGLMALRFFIGILGGSFVPCQVWTTGFFDKNVVGTANALTGGLGNAGGGVTYFVMPAVYRSLVERGLTTHVAWRVSFIVPGILIIATAITLVLCCPDTPVGKWADRAQAAESNLRHHAASGPVVDIPNEVTTEKATSNAGSESPNGVSDEEKKLDDTRGTFGDHEAQMGEQQMVDIARGEIIQKPSIKEILRVVGSASTLVTAACYFCSFGSELAINSILGNYYAKNFPKLGLQNQGNWAAMFGLLNVVTRPLGGYVADLVYGKIGSLWGKKALLHAYGLIFGAFLVAVGATDPKDQATMFGLVAGAAFFLEGANGINYALVPHVHPYANGVVSGFTGASGNLGGIIFAIIFRYNGKDYGKSFWIIGLISMCINLAVSWIRPVPKGQIGGR